MELIRQYKNADGNDIRIDTIIMTRRQEPINSKANTHTFLREIKIRCIYNTSVSDREVAEIEIIGDFTSLDGSAYAWAEWDSPHAIVDMTDLPFVGDTV